MSKTLVLASTSRYRRALLERLGQDFTCAAPNIDETRLAQESAHAMVQRLARAKADAVGADHPNSLIIGSDQCAVLGEIILGKPGTHENAIAQLRACSGQQVQFHTGLCVLDTHTGNAQIEDIRYTVYFRRLSDNDIEHYLRKEQPYDCAGSFKSEGLGVALFEKMRGDDPSALIGLPMIRLSALLREAGLDVLSGPR